MRRKVLQATVSAVVVAVILLGFPLAFIGAQFVGDGEAAELTARTDSLARSVDTRIANGEEIPQFLVDNAADATGRLPAHIVVIDPDGNRVEGGEPIEGEMTADSRRTDGGAFITVSVSSLQIALRELQVVVLVVVASFVAFVAGISVAVWQANRLAAPSSTSPPRRSSSGPGRCGPGSNRPVSRRSTSSHPSWPAARTGWPSGSPRSGSSPRTRRTSSARR
ncbi:hypothetical protein GCM10025865_21320 [Paraoerskovia sediminicola]|uniref:Histidine kinase DraK N-terminal domain-containing protein n=1 Tax=Paraoerskovia sediminicola TaxID=1138587 RepID=A0ABM8G419_9CELL|nr:hypothetical protein GCM10025865_21320 [Paraoerskovia sediminicola]